jgi:signal transduction histidine kinase
MDQTPARLATFSLRLQRIKTVFLRKSLVGIRPRLPLILLGVGVLLLAALSVLNYLNSVRVVETELRGELKRDALAITRHIERQLHEREDALVSLAQSAALRDYVRGATQSPLGAELPKELAAEVRATLENNRKYYAAIACLGADKQPLFRAELNFKRTPPVLFQTRDFLTESVKADERVWTIAEQAPLETILAREAYGSVLRYAIPIFTEQVDASAPRGALIVDYKLDALLGDAVSVSDYQSTPAFASEFATTPRLVLMLDRAGNVVYHTNAALKYQPITASMPQAFAPITSAMKEGQAGWQFYDSTEGDRWLAVYQPIKTLDLSVMVAGDYSVAVQGLRFMGWTGIGLTTLVGALMAALLWLSLRRTSRSIVHVTEGTVAIARGELDQRIEVRSSDETHLLAETINTVKERLREQLAREAEMRQFDSFMRLSAMLTHDLKNSILTLSLIVSNMREQFHNEGFRADAMKSLTEATDKMRAMVAKLSEPVRSLSGEFKRPRPTDLIPIINRVLARTIEPASAEHEVEIHLPSTLVAIADDERIEKVLENLVLNAIEAMGADKGKLTVEAGDEAEEGFVFFSVSDTGPGMSEEFQRTKLFRPFSTTKPKGIGLGLYASRELIRALGGSIKAESERGSGTTFRVVLPSGRIEGKG